MRGERPTRRNLGIDLDLEELVLPANLLSEETLSQDALEEEPQSPYRVLTTCAGCSASLRLFIIASDCGVRALQQSLLGDLSFVCVNCSKDFNRHGR
ncbi:E7 protein [Vulpes vulpes papillomavirus 1]|uniref:Protein E7 n=1 Tax=Vulpes vulpes papillomavirus 1 TaxID=1163709 RepID=A0A0A7BVP7_9PAPI|nr:E7 protein [Vulpes vulpes papillomavirus 1]AHM27267.1 E7 protein [Vulpes vulpes papillomavirus 1]